MAYLDRKEHKDWRKRLIARDKGCAICGDKEKMCAHHLIPKEVIKFRSNDMNGIILCSRHHGKYGYCISPHNDSSVVFAIWLSENRPKQWQWLKENWKLHL